MSEPTTEQSLKERIAALLQRVEEVQEAVALIWNANGAYPSSTWMPTPLMQSWIDKAKERTERITALEQERDALKERIAELEGK